MQTYYAKSVILSKTLWINLGLFVVAALELSEVTNLIPDTAMPSVLAVVAIVNLALRMFTVRPVAVIGPDEKQAVQVKSL